MIEDMDKDMSVIQTGISMRDHLRKVEHVDKGSMFGSQGRSMMENGNKELSKAMEFGKELKVILTLVNGMTLRPMAMVFILGRTGIGMRESGTLVLNTDRELIYLQMEMFTLGLMSEESQKEKDSTNGRMDRSIRVRSRME